MVVGAIGKLVGATVKLIPARLRQRLSDALVKEIKPKEQRLNKKGEDTFTLSGFWRANKKKKLWHECLTEPEAASPAGSSKSQFFS